MVPATRASRTIGRRGSATFSIHLARHLPTIPRSRGLLDHARFAELLAHAAERSVALDASVGPALLAAAARSQRLVSSTLLRAEQTVRVIKLALGPTCPPTERWAELVEADQPALAWPWVRLTEGGWSAASRGAWAVGWSFDGESRAAAQDRAKRAVDRFETLASSGDAATVIAHGCFNVLLAAELRRRGWQGPLLPDVRPAHFSSYRWCDR